MSPLSSAGITACKDVPDFLKVDSGDQNQVLMLARQAFVELSSASFRGYEGFGRLSALLALHFNKI